MGYYHDLLFCQLVKMLVDCIKELHDCRNILIKLTLLSVVIFLLLWLNVREFFAYGPAYVPVLYLGPSLVGCNLLHYYYLSHEFVPLAV